ncbi:hypothetical protein OCL45_08605 [Neisseria gonorrhoeae]|nr:hypothetical protein OCL45_08605 [Neisseria gonorrhoeae]
MTVRSISPTVMTSALLQAAMTSRAMPQARWFLPVPLLPEKIMLRPVCNTSAKFAAYSGRPPSPSPSRIESLTA